MKSFFKKILIAPLILLVIGIMFMFGQSPLMEGYNIFSPYIDTEFAEKYTPELFDKITTKMDSTEVVKIIGHPLWISKDTLNGSITTVFSYTDDGFFRRSGKSRNFLEIDFAWYSSEITFDDEGNVIKISKCWCYD